MDQSPSSYFYSLNRFSNLLIEFSFLKLLHNAIHNTKDHHAKQQQQTSPVKVSKKKIGINLEACGTLIVFFNSGFGQR